MKKNGLLVLLAGPSGVGKTTIAQKLELLDTFSLIHMSTYTTRLPRPHEKNGIDYNFISKEEFEQKIKNDFFIEHVTMEFSGDSYGAPKIILQKLHNGNNVILVVDRRGVQFWQKHYTHCISFWIYASEDIIKNRIYKRLNNVAFNTEEIQKRIINGISENLNEIKHKVCDYTIENNDLEKSIESISDIVNSFL